MDLEFLGVGISYRTQFSKNITKYYQEIDFIEIIADQYLHVLDFNKSDLLILKQLFPIVLHGVGCSLGIDEKIDETYLKQFLRIVNYTNPKWISEHLSFTRIDNIDLGHLASLPFTYEAAGIFIKNLKYFESKINKKLIFENITYPFAVPTSQLSEPNFISHIIKESGSGLLLDVTNLYANSYNHKYDPYTFLDQIPLEKVVQLHYTGGHLSKFNEYVDSHDALTPEPIWKLIDEVVKRAPLKGIILERDDDEAQLEDIIEEITRAKEILKKYNKYEIKTNTV